MAADSAAFLERWHRVVAARDLAGLRELIADGASLGAPPYWDRFEGIDLVHHLLGLILHTIEDFRYHREWVNGAELALEFTGHVDGLELQGIDLITLDEEGKLVGLDVMIRPVNAVTALIARVAPRMTEYLAARSRAGEA